MPKMPYFCKNNHDIMKKQLLILSYIACAFVAFSCRSGYHVTDIQRSRILIDNTYDRQPDAQAAAFIKPYQHEVDSIMSPVMGTVANYMASHRPESELSNLLADILVWASKRYGEQSDMAVYNMGGIRAAFSKGKVTYGDIVDVAPFENKICFVTLSGEKLLLLFRQIAARGGEGVSHGVELAITKDKKLESARLHGKEIDPQASYRVATLDYLAQGNDGMGAFKSATNVVSPQEKSNNVRFIIMDYFREYASQGKAVEKKIEGRIVVKP